MLGSIFGRKKRQKHIDTNYQRGISTIPEWAQRYVRSLSLLMRERGTLMKLTRVSRGARWVTVEISPVNRRGAVNANYFLSANTQRALMLDSGSDSIRVDIRGGAVRYQFQLPEAMWRYYTRQDLASPEYVGIADGRQFIPFSVFDEAMPHSIVVGGSGSGKSTAVASMIFSLVQSHTPDDVKIAIVDAEEEAVYSGFKNEAHLLTQVSSDAQAVIGTVFAEFTRRVNAGVNGNVSPRVVLFVDEILSRGVLHVVKHRTREQWEMLGMLSEIAKRGRRRGIHLVVATQSYTRDDLPFESQLRNRWVGAVASAHDSVQLSGVPQIGAQRLSGKGDFLHVPIGDVVRFQVAEPTPGDYAGLERVQMPHAVARTTSGNTVPQRGKAGRPANRLDNPEILAAYICYGKKITSRAAQNHFGITDYHHRQYKQFAGEVVANIKKCTGGK